MSFVESVAAINLPSMTVGAFVGGFGTIITIWIRHRFGLKSLSFGNLHEQKILLYPQLMGLVDKTIAALEVPLAKENDMNDADLERITKYLNEFSFLPNIRLIADAKLARVVESFTSIAGYLFETFRLYHLFIKKGHREGINYLPVELKMRELKEVRSIMYDLTRKEMGTTAI